MVDTELHAAARAYVEEVWDDVERDIDALLRIESVEDLDTSREGAPFGEGPHQALDEALAIAGRLGLKTQDCDGYIGFAEVAGKSEEYIATIAHADIVPVGTGWHFEPLRLTSKDGYLIGRGVLDDKGPLVLSLYAARFAERYFRSAGVPMPYTLRCIVGTNEETGMRDVDYYLKNHRQPLFCFTPDACFPAICGEKGRALVEVQGGCGTRGEDRIVVFEGGVAGNAIASDARAIVVASPGQMRQQDGIEVESAGQDEWGRSLVQITAHGKSGHAAMPDGSMSAVGMIVRYLLDHEVHSQNEYGFLEMCRRAYTGYDGKALGIDAVDDLFDPLTCSATTAFMRQAEGEGARLVQCLDIRYPPSTTSEAILAGLADVARPLGCEVALKDNTVPFLTSPHTPEVKTLLGAYEEVHGHAGEAYTIGGGTYARHFLKAVAFGPVDEQYAEDPSWVGPEHGPDEGVLRAQLQRALQTYCMALVRLMQLDLT